jgi:hypothetical protein
MNQRTSHAPNNSHLTYTLTTQYAKHENDAIEASLIADTVEEFAAYRDDFILIEPSSPIEDSLYMQAACLVNDPSNIILEMRFRYPDQSFKHYSLQTTDKNEVVRILVDYWRMQKLPDYSTWNDITSDFS